MIKSKKKAMICFYKGDINDNIHVLEELDSKGVEVHLFNNIDEENLNFDMLLSIIKDLYGAKNDDYDIYIGSNIKEFIMLEYILYNNIIAGALYINNNSEHIKLEELYEKILNKEMCLNTNVPNFYVLKNEENLFNGYSLFDGSFKFDNDNYRTSNKVYVYKGENYVFSINDYTSNDEIERLELDEINNEEVYKYCFDLYYIDEYISLIEHYANSIDDFKTNYKMAWTKLSKFKDMILKATYFEKNMINLDSAGETANH